MPDTADPAAAADLLVVGDALLDRDLDGRSERLTPDSRVPVVEGCTERVRPGGAALAACLAARDGRRVTLLTGLGEDPASRRLRALLAPWVTVVPLPLEGELPEKIRILDRGRPVARLDRGAGRATGDTEAARAALAAAGAVLVADYGRGAADALRGLLAERAAEVPVVWDPHPRGRPPVRGTRLATPAAAEARHFAGRLPGTAHCAVLRTVGQRAQALVHAWGVAAVAVTLGARGALLSHGGGPLLMPTARRHGGDACGAGDQFAATAAGVMADGGTAEEAVRTAVSAAADYVADGGAGALDFRAGPGVDLPHGADTAHAVTVGDPLGAVVDAPGGPGGPGAVDGADPLAVPPDGAPPDAWRLVERLVERVRARGGTVVAAGGCFDLLHTGHVALLQQARRAGDCLVVCLNSDDSVRRLKGPGRPIVPAADRARLLRALRCVDAVVVFDEDTPERLLERLRPDVWVKGGDYTPADLPEAALLARWGGRTLTVAYQDGRSSTALAARAAACAAARQSEGRPDAAASPSPPATTVTAGARGGPGGGRPVAGRRSVVRHPTAGAAGPHPAAREEGDPR